MSESDFNAMKYRVEQSLDRADHLRKEAKERSGGVSANVVYCSSCGGEFHVKRTGGFSHCEDHAGLHNYDND